MRKCGGGGGQPPSPHYPDATRLYSHKNKVQTKCTSAYYKCTLAYYNCSGDFIVYTCITLYGILNTLHILL